MTGTITLKAESAGVRLDSFLAENISELTRSAAQRLIEEGVLQPRVDQVVWSDEDMEKLFRLRAQGNTWAEIADIFGRKLSACQMAYKREKGKRNEKDRILRRMADGGGND